MFLEEDLLKEERPDHCLTHGVGLVEQGVEIGQQGVSYIEGQTGGVLHGLAEWGWILGLQQTQLRIQEAHLIQSNSNLILRKYKQIHYK